ncbi:SIR2 family protein [Nocardioides daejeonensis]|uniref:SIR2 family protein n=1 Tax=Nocardioides daejeonensis TaxID=1046556 RepID=UPI001EF4F7E0|nr:SIR2 family protein [Nocardioides daejeonensis]
MFIFGAGASFDSDPKRRFILDPHEERMQDGEWRPPLATRLFEPSSREARDCALEFVRASPLLMHLRSAAAAGDDIEEVLETYQSERQSFSALQPQLTALRAYLSRLLTKLPDQWHEDAVGQTNYVSLLNELAPVVEQSGQGARFVTFNYDRLLEYAIQDVYGKRFREIEDYISSPEVHLYKPHGSVNWSQAAKLAQDLWLGEQEPDDVLHVLIELAANLEWLPNDYRVDDPEDGDPHRDSQNHTYWLPALAVPARSKATFSCPKSHLDALARDLGDVTTVVTVGWRGRERHFLDLMATHLKPGCRLLVVAEHEVAAMATVDELWSTQRFGRYAISADGFSTFASSRVAMPMSTPYITATDLIAETDAMNWIAR